MITSLQTTFENKTFEEVAIARLREHEPKIRPYRLAFSGGKDSVVIKHLADRAGVSYQAHMALTTIDPPDVVKFVRKQYPDVFFDKPKRNMFQIIEQRKALPTRTMRFCCRELKEMGKKGDTVITGIRWAESARRRTRLPFEESTITKGLYFVNPVIDWSTQDIWDYIRRHNVQYCNLYDKGYERIGCIMCPLQSEKGMRRDAERFPAVYRRYLKAIQRVLDNNPNACWKGKTAGEVMEWWITLKGWR